MTRINSAIPVKYLTDEHLLAEHREIKRLPYYLKRACKTSSIKRIPEKFVLGSGHITFFLDKMKFVFERYQKIHEECIARGFDVIDYSDNWSDYKEDDRYWNDYHPSEEEKKMLIERISDRIENSKKNSWHFNKEKISKERAIKMIK